MPRLPRMLRWFLLGAVALCLIGLLVVGILVYVVSARLPDVQSLRNTELQEPLYVYAADGRLMGLFGDGRGGFCRSRRSKAPLRPAAP